MTIEKLIQKDLKNLNEIEHLIDITTDCVECYTKENPLLTFRAWVKDRNYTIEIRLSDDGITHVLELKDYETALQVYKFVFDSFAEQREVIKNMFAF